MTKGSGAAQKNPVTVSQVLGEITWLVSQSARHSAFRVSDLAWFVMPAIALRQFHIFRDGDRPVGVALWAFPTPSGEAKLGSEAPGTSNQLHPDEWAGGEHLWLVDIVAPLASKANRHYEIMLADLITGPFRDKEFRVFRGTAADPAQRVAIISAGASDKLVSQIAMALSQDPLQ